MILAAFFTMPSISFGATSILGRYEENSSLEIRFCELITVGTPIANTGQPAVSLFRGVLPLVIADAGIIPVEDI